MDSVFQKFKSLSFSTMSLKEQCFFIKRLSFLTKANIPILESLIMVHEQTYSKTHLKILEVVINDVSSGQSLSRSLAKFPKLFGEFAISIISLGESTGTLSDNLIYLSDELKKKDELRKKIIGALIYPCIITLATFGIVGFLMIYLFPKITPVFKSLHMSLPFSTRAVMLASNFLIHHGLALFIFIILLAIFLIVTYKKVPKINLYTNKLIFKVPLVGKITKDFNLANLSRTLGLLLKSGLTLNQALLLPHTLSGNQIYHLECKRIATIINQGGSISKELGQNKKLFPDVFTQIVSTGDKTGNLANSFLYLAEFYESEVNEFTKNISTLVEPVLLVIMGLIVGFIAVSIITPIYSITQNLHG